VPGGGGAELRAQGRREAPEERILMKVQRDEPNEDVLLNLTAFIDMMLVLVIFFLATSRFQQEERDESIRLASTRSKLPISTVTDLLVINVDKEGQKIVDGRLRTLQEVEEIVRKRRAENENAEIVLRIDVRARVLSEREVTEICHRLGFKVPSIAYETGEE
jgi:biopolymer transport protein ExbD